MSENIHFGFSGKTGRWTKLALAVGAASMAMVAANVKAEETTEEEVVELESYTFTGSRVKRTAIEGSLPITVIEREEIDRSGDVSVADFVRGLSVNSFGSFRQQSGSSAQGLASVNIRGLGSARTLVLIDGHRAPKAPYAASSADLNAIPLAAVERIEVLKDGASAIYGSDAIGGVVNIVLREDFDGAQIMYGKSSSPITGGDKTEGSVLVGVDGDNGNVVLGASFNKTDIVYSRDQREFTTEGASFFSNNYVTPADGYSTVNPVPGACAELEGGYYEVPFPFSTTGTRCAFDFTLAAANEASTEVRSIFSKGLYHINDDWDLYSTVSFANSESFGRYAPTPAIFFVPGSASGIDHDADGTDDDVYVYHRFAALGNRDNTVTGYVGDLTIGTKGVINDSIYVDTGVRYNKYKTYDVGRNYAVLPIVEKYAEEGRYNFRNPFGNPEEVLNAMKATISRESTWETEEVWASASMDAFELPGGMAGVAFGAEYQGIKYLDQYDSLSEAGVIGGSAGNSAGADRSLSAYFAEIVLPIHETLEVDLAVRYDSYSDYGSDVSPKFSFIYTPLDSLTVRGSAGKGFRAPTLDVISQKPSFSAESVTTDEATCIVAGGEFDGNSCSVNVQVDTTIVANESLSSETSDQFSLGVVFAPTEDFDVSIDAYRIKIEDSIQSVSVADLLFLEDREIAPPPGLGCERNPSRGNALSECTAGFGNLGYLKVSGFDIASSYTLALPAGSLATYLDASYVANWEQNNGIESTKLAGLLGQPKWRGNLETVYTVSDFELTWLVNYIGRQETVTGSGPDTVKTDAEAWTTHDLQFSYFTPINSKISVGVQNAFDKSIPLYGSGGRPYNFSLYNAYGRVAYARYTQSF